MTEAPTEANLLSVENARQILKMTENIGSVMLNMDGSGGIPVFDLPPGWNVGLKGKESIDLTDAKLAYDDVDYTLTKEAVLGIAHSIGLSPAYVAKTPGVLIQSHLNYWATHSPEVALKLLTNGDNEVLAITKESIKPFSNIEILERVVAAITAAYGVFESEMLVDFKWHHDLHDTTIRVIVSSESEEIVTTRQENEATDMWSPGIQVRNSLTGKFPTSVQGYLFNWTNLSGAVMQHAAARYNRKVMGQKTDEFYDWVTDSSKKVLETIEHEFEIVSALPSESVADSVTATLTSIYKTYKVPLKVRQTITDTLVESEDYTYYGVMNAIITAANTPDLPHHFSTTIMEIGGMVANDLSHLCGKCKQVVV